MTVKAIIIVHTSTGKSLDSIKIYDINIENVLLYKNLANKYDCLDTPISGPNTLCSVKACLQYETYLGHVKPL